MKWEIEGRFREIGESLDSITEEIGQTGKIPASFGDKTVWGELKKLHLNSTNKLDFFKLVDEKNHLQSRLGNMENKYEELLRFLKVEFFEERVVQGNKGITTRGYRKITK